MAKRYIQPVLFAFLLGCGCSCGPFYKIQYEYRCTTEEETEKLATWVATCIKDANPQADEEPEDWIRQCERTGSRILCPQVRTVTYANAGGWSRNVPCDVATDKVLKEACEEGLE